MGKSCTLTEGLGGSLNRDPSKGWAAGESHPPPPLLKVGIGVWAKAALPAR